MYGGHSTFPVSHGVLEPSEQDVNVTLTLRCYASKHGRLWHAICTDLDIAADGASFQDARASLLVCIELYLEGITELAPAQQRQFLARRSPWYVRLKMALLAALRFTHREKSRPRRFVLQSQVAATA